MWWWGGVFMARGVHGRGCAWQGVCMAGGVCGGGHVWQGDMCGRGGGHVCRRDGH